MEFIINETGELKELTIIDSKTGVDWSSDLIGNSGAVGDYIHYDDAAGAYSIGQASQPIISTNYGAGNGDRIRQTLRYALGTAAVFGVIWTAAVQLVPNLFVRIFMTPTEEILAIAPAIIRCYGISFLLLPLNIFSTYYFQAVMKPAASFVVSVVRGAFLSGILILLLPAAAGADALWFAMPITEAIVVIYVAVMMAKYTRELPQEAAVGR